MPDNLNIQTGEFIFREGETANYAYVLVEGEVEIVKSTGDGYLTLTSIDKGAIFGEMALIDGQPRSAGARVSKDAVVTEVNAQTFLQYIQKNPTAAFNIMKRLSEQLRAANKQISVSGQASDNDQLDDKFADYLDQIETSIDQSILDTDHIYNAGPKKSIMLAGITVSMAFIIAISFLSIFSVDTTVHTTGKFLTTVPNIEVQATNNSVIKSLNVSRGSTVKRGEIIAVLDGTIARSNLKANSDKISAAKNRLSRIELEQRAIKESKEDFLGNSSLDAVNLDILSKRVQQYRSKNISLNSQISKLGREVLSAKNNVKLAQNQLELKQKIKNVQKSLYEQKVSSYFKYLSTKDAALVAEKSLAEAKGKLEKLKSEMREMRSAAAAPPVAPTVAPSVNQLPRDQLQLAAAPTAPAAPAPPVAPKTPAEWQRHGYQGMPTTSNRPISYETAARLHSMELERQQSVQQLLDDEQDGMDIYDPVAKEALPRKW